MAAAVTAIRKKNGAVQDEGDAYRFRSPRDLPPPRNENTWVNKEFGHIGMHFGMWYAPKQVKVMRFYMNPIFTWFVAAVIIFNFIAIIIEKEYDPYPCPDEGPCLQVYRNVWKQLDNVCNVISSSSF